MPSRLRAWLPQGAHRIVQVLLCLWALGLVVAAVELDQWRREIGTTLLQLQADRQFRSGAARRQEAIDPEWHRRKALTLLAATDRLHADAWWTALMPGSWRAFDDLEERVQARVEQEFGQIVIETVRRELHARASRLTGVPQHAGGELKTDAACRPPARPPASRRLSSAPDDLAEFQALQAFVEALEPLDDAVQALQALQQGGRDAVPRRLHALVLYTLDAEPHGSLLRGTRLFDAGEPLTLQPLILRARLQAAVRCSFDKGLEALYERLLAGNDLFALEQALAERSAGLFTPAARPANFDSTLERYRAVAGLLEDQHALLATGHNAWMRLGTQALGPRWQELQGRVERLQLLGPPAVAHLQGRSGAAWQAFQRQFERLYGTGAEPGIVWVEDERRFAQSPARTALRKGLAGLLKEPFMTADAARKVAVVSGSELAGAAAAAGELAHARDRFVSEGLPVFPPEPRMAVARLVDARVSDLVYQEAFRALKAGPAQPAAGQFDPVRYGERHEQVARIQARLDALGAAHLGERLVATVEGELLQRLAALHEQAGHAALLVALQANIAGWQGDPLPVWRQLDVGDAAGLAAGFARQAATLDALAAQAAPLLAHASPRLAREPVVRDWALLVDELRRFRGRQPGSSLVALQDYLGALGPDLQRDNCAQRLEALAPFTPGQDPIGRAHQQLHQGLLARCAQWRTAAPAGPA